MQVSQFDDINYPHLGEVISESQAMQLAIQVAQLGAASVAPNPMVGCVIVDRSHRFLSSGYHEKYGQAHAEVNAIKNINSSDQLQDAMMYVTLEPCAHIGRTPSCAKAIAELPIKKVVFGLRDPNPLVSGQGAKIIQSSGKECIEYFGALKTELEILPEIFLKNFKQKKIFVAVKIASSLDGQMALQSGESKWITGPDSREFSHELRSRYDAVLVGKNTVLRDDPSLDIRHSKIAKKNKIVILDRSKAILSDIKKGKQFKVAQCHGLDNIVFPSGESLPEIMTELWGMGIRSIFVEGGAEVVSSFFTAGLVDRLHLFSAPIVLGAGGGISWTKNLSVSQLADGKKLKNLVQRKFGDDFYVSGNF